MAAAVLLVPAAAPCTAAAAAGAPQLLDVPYLPQTEALCGGAAAAMVMRYWGAGAVYADAFSALVDPAAGGIRGEDLMGALRERGWKATSFRGDSGAVAGHLAAGRPLIALIEDRPGQFHYVVIVGWHRGRVVAHDPARAPFRVHDEDGFVRAWSASGFWTLLALPGAPVPGAGDPVADRPADPVAASPCAAMVSEGVRLSGTGALERARQLLELAADACPGESPPRRELAGLHALRGEWRLAATRAREALERDPGDAHASRILATSLFLDGDPAGALDAWNDLGEPAIDLVNVAGLDRIRYAVAARLLDLEPRELLTARALAQARRRLAELPGASIARVSYAPLEGGRANVEAVVVERPLLPAGVVGLGALGARAGLEREAAIAVANATGGGETLAASWRWWAKRPRVALSVAAPSPVVGAVWRVDAFYDRQTYWLLDADVEETWQGVSVSMADWLDDRWRWEAGLGVDRWNGRSASPVFRGALAWHARDERLRIGVDAAIRVGGIETQTISAAAEWRSAARPDGFVWHARGGLDGTGTSAPLALWPGAGTGHARAALLRAHPLLDDGVVRGGVFGRTLYSGGVEARRWFQPGTRVLRVAPAVFVDAARATRSLPAFDRRWHVDAGAGVRLAIPGGGAIRLDVARGLRDGAMAVSAGWGL